MATPGAMAVAQSGASIAGRMYATREMLERQADSAEVIAHSAGHPAALREHKRAEAWLLRQRLQAGDFLVGDRIAITVDGHPALTDTVTVRSGGTIELGTLPPIVVRGVLRSELDEHLTTELAKYVREPRVTAVPLLRLGVMGPVRQPGFYHVPADVLVSDLIMQAGGLATDADFERSEIRRGDEALYDGDGLSVAIRDGLSLDALHLRSGDELVVEPRRRVSLMTVIQGATIVSGLLTVIIALSSR